MGQKYFLTECFAYLEVQQIFTFSHRINKKYDEKTFNSTGKGCASRTEYNYINYINDLSLHLNLQTGTHSTPVKHLHGLRLV